MKKRLVIRATRFIGLAGLAGALSAQINLNRIPSRAIGWPLLNISNSSNPNLVEGRELYAPQAVAIDNSVSPPMEERLRFFQWRKSGLCHRTKGFLYYHPPARAGLGLQFRPIRSYGSGRGQERKSVRGGHR